MLGQFLTQIGSVSERIQSAADYFKNPSLTSSQLVLLLCLLGGVIAAIIIVRLIFKITMARLVYLPTYDVREPAKILRLLDSCIARRSKIEFKIVGRQNSSQIVSGMPEAILNKHIIVVMTVPFSDAQKKLSGEQVHCYFKLQENNRQAFFNFHGNIAQVRAGNSGFLELAIPVPDVLMAGQKRNFMRIEPPRNLILEICLWPEYTGSATDWETEIQDLPPPTLSNADQSRGNIRIKNISAGGIRLISDKAILGATGLVASRGARFMLRLNLWDPVESTELSLWMICRVIIYMINPGGPNVDLGVQFIAWSQVRNPDTGELSWIRLEHEDDGVPPLDDWIAKRYLEEYRKRKPG